ncbi:hypothetical protein [Alicyclobacillus sp. SO9]|uniref:hypothetical protein n=1 Tax=Alicyclobacillus sp. SO9 TaxID=2665646 RepID=UPI0018E86647|nr:hypothetical protein [Alicyclobacillus sp. SO9]
MEWNEGNWKCQVSGSNKSYVINESQKIVSYLHIHLLPKTMGTLGVMQTNGGNHTELHWAIGNVLFAASNYHQAMNAIKMVISMRMYPSGKSTGVQY